MSNSKLSWNLRRFGLSPQILKERLLLNTPDHGFFITSQPKSGTHLLERVLCLMPGIYRPIMRTVNEHNLGRYGGFENIAESAIHGRLIVSHLHFHPDWAQKLSQKQVRSFAMTRDPRAMVLSYVHYVQKRADHAEHQRLKNLSVEEAINLLINEKPEDNGENFITNMNLFAGWTKQPEIFSVRFEDLVGPNREKTVVDIANHAGIDLKPEQIDIIVENAFSAASPTFRSGRIDEWKNVLNAKQITKIEDATQSAMSHYYST
ncbi:hypothetical protein BVC71_02795 [Marivivens niveibacter]|uniref:Sulfotransferase domain-containing protein n=1 Tax=Marivivens niveibacter TaxID=1930667 RepID=A0A251X1H1_9RHOB|nr:sulfotransferase domain-containing protein [Marivivens niveibacter]OUD10446.1 hypothetical protein BVC71_02795 [Marivivens niveibacter]